MYKKILATLDGSSNAECTLPYAEDFSKKYGAQVVLLGVVEPIVTLDDEHHTAYEDRQIEALQQSLGGSLKRYLDNKEKELKAKGVNVRSLLLMGKPAEQIVDYASKEGVDLILIATHGRSGRTNWAYGSVAEKVLRGASAHTMLVRCPPAMA